MRERGGRETGKEREKEERDRERKREGEKERQREIQTDTEGERERGRREGWLFESAENALPKILRRQPQSVKSCSATVFCSIAWRTSSRAVKAVVGMCGLDQRSLSSSFSS